MTPSPHRLLIIDDETSIKTNLMRYLEDYDGFDLAVAGSGEEGLDLLRRAPADVCVVDMRLPGMNGHQFITEAAAEQLCSRFLIHTGSLGVTLTEELRALGLEDDDLFFKPCDITRLHARIMEHLSAMNTRD